MKSQHAIEPCRRIDGEIRVPGDKSISHRAVLIGAIGVGGMEIVDLSPSADVAASARAVRSLGVTVEGVPGGRPHGAPAPDNDRPQPNLEGASLESLDFQIKVNGLGRNALKAPESDIDVANSGTTIRLLTGILAAGSVTATLTGDMSIKRRPMRRVVQPLRAMGADITGADEGERAPLTIRGQRLHGVAHRLDIPSAQVKSALLLAGLAAEGETSVQEPSVSRDHTERMLEYLGIRIDKSDNRLIVKSTEIQNASLTIPGDLSSAAFLLVAAAIIPGSHVVVRDVGINPTRSGILDVLVAYGAEVTISDERSPFGEPVATVAVRAAERRPVIVEGELTLRTIDELPLVAVLGAFSDGGVTEIRDAAELRVKESDRIATTAAMLRAFGSRPEVLPDGLVIRGGMPLTGATVDSAGDHRIAMSAAVAGLAAEGRTLIDGWECVAVSYPGFAVDLASLTVR